jgi:hypothetical protein
MLEVIALTAARTAQQQDVAADPASRTVCRSFKKIGSSSNK